MINSELYSCSVTNRFVIKSELYSCSVTNRFDTKWNLLQRTLSALDRTINKMRDIVCRLKD